MPNSHQKNIRLSREKVQRQNKIRDKFKKERVQKVTLPQNKLYLALKQLGKEKKFKLALEREIYTKEGVRFSDIFIKKYGLNIEVDGGYHFSEAQESLDNDREKEIWDKKRIITIRFTNVEILNNIDTVLLKLSDLMSKLDKLPNWKCPGKGQKKLFSTMSRKKLWTELAQKTKNLAVGNSITQIL